MSEGSLRERLTTGTEDHLGRALSDLLENPILTGAIGRAFDVREKAAQAQELAMGALNLPSASDIERLTRRLRSFSQRIEGIEDGIDRLDRTLAAKAAAVAGSGAGAVEDRLGAVERQLQTLTTAIAEIREDRTSTSRPRASRRATPSPRGSSSPAATSPAAGTRNAANQAALKGGSSKKPSPKRRAARKPPAKPAG